MSKQTRDAWTKTINQRAIAQTAKRSKYGAVKTTVDGIVFDSKKEAQRYHELKLMEKAGQIDSLEIQPEYELWTSAGRAFAHVPVGVYRADFRYCIAGRVDSQVVEDVKGFKTPLYRWKKKHVEAQYGIQIKEI